MLFGIIIEFILVRQYDNFRFGLHHFVHNKYCIDMKMPLGPANSTKLLTNSKTILYFINLLFVRKQSNGNDNVITTIFSTHYLRFNSITDSCGQLFYSNAKIFIALQWKVATSLILLPKRLPIREEILKNSFLHVNNHTIILVYKKIGI